MIDGTTDLFTALRTTGSIRRFRPDAIPGDVLHRILEAATHAPSAWNAQPWCFVAVRAPAQRRAIATAYRQAWEAAQAFTARTDADALWRARPGHARLVARVDELAQQLDSAPVLVLACLDTAQLGPMADGHGNILAPQSAYASIFPAVQNLMLAARGCGVGSTLTTVYALHEAEIRRALDVPAHMHIAALIPLGYPLRPFRVTQRKPLESVVYLDRWGEPLKD